MAFWWPLLVLAFAYGLCRFLFMLIPPKVPSIDVEASDVLDDGNQAQENSFIYVPPRGTSQQSGKIVQCYEPATMKYLGYVPALTRDEVKDRVAKVRKAQKMWAKTSFKQRRTFLRILLKYIIKHQALICEISSRDTGKTMVDASLGEIMTTCEKINWLLSEGEQWLKPEYRSSGRSMLHKRAKVEFHPLGVIGAIVSWNYPFHNIFNPMLTAVFSGNGIVIKISEHASWSGCFYFRIIQSALAAIGAPEDLVEVITGFAETGEALVSSVDKVIFVGSPGVGKMIMRNAAETLIPVTLELGGKDVFIVCDDVDVDHGPPLAGKYDMGALCMHEHSEKLEGLINDALDKGAEIVARGSFGHIGEDAVDQYFPPTVIVNVNHSMRLMQEEAFGPIMPIMKFSSDEEVVKLANDSKYGLGCAVFSGSQDRARDIASQIHCGVAAVNDFAATYMCQSLPFGGVKHSGFGRFGGVEGLRACCLVKAVVEDRWWPFVKTKIPKPIQYPVAENAFEFQESLVEALYGLNIWERLQALVNVLKMLTEQNPAEESIRDIFVTLVANSLIEFFSKVELITNDTYVIFSFVFFKKNIAFSMYLNLFLYTNTLIFLYNKKVLS
ncbi:hypothetical protein Ahy_B01g055536 isoform A [Arachis hypogaea]|uniref:Aldehyde dehydrogenase domain-containing protein n=1 Tax=Arachis hypogaea TaxID=3818 RepID=A0A445AWH7_ARAHY|nr:hypothetical protein Ahy_B01g055536 isoform A [Arachis hypogaea]